VLCNLLSVYCSLKNAIQSLVICYIKVNYAVMVYATVITNPMSMNLFGSLNMKRICSGEVNIKPFNGALPSGKM
jgi:hypothetical protein